MNKKLTEAKDKELPPTNTEGQKAFWCVSNCKDYYDAVKKEIRTGKEVSVKLCRETLNKVCKKFNLSIDDAVKLITKGYGLYKGLNEAKEVKTKELSKKEKTTIENSFKNLDEVLDANIKVGADLHNFGGENNDVDVLNAGNLKDTLTELLDLDVGVDLDAHEFGGKGNDVDVLNGGKLGEALDSDEFNALLTDTAWAGVRHPFRGPDINPRDLLGEGLENEPGYDELLQYVRKRRARKNEELEQDMSDDEFVEAFGEALVKNNIKSKKSCTGKNCEIKEDLNGYDEEDFGFA